MTLFCSSETVIPGRVYLATTLNASHATISYVYFVRSNPTLLIVTCTLFDQNAFTLVFESQRLKEYKGKRLFVIFLSRLNTHGTVETLQDVLGFIYFRNG